MPEGKILKGLNQIRRFINPDSRLSRDTVKELIRQGMPCMVIGNTYYAHSKNIDRWFREYTDRDLRKAPVEIKQSIDKGEID